MRMRTPGRQSRYLHASLLTVGLLAALACAPLGARTPTEPAPQPPSPTAQPTAQSQPTPTPTTQPPGQENPSPPGAADVEGMDLVSCPQPGSAMLLKFSAHIDVEYGDAKITHTLEDGLLNLMVDDGDASTAQIESVESPSIPYLMTGAMRDCSFEGEGTMNPTASGHCQDGVVYLTIVENWGPYKGKMTCKDAVVPFNIPAMGTMTHTGADGQGEVFYLDKGFSTEGAGYTTIRPYAGPAGSGEHIWTLFYDLTGPVR